MCRRGGRGLSELSSGFSPLTPFFPTRVRRFFGTLVPNQQDTRKPVQTPSISAQAAVNMLRGLLRNAPGWKRSSWGVQRKDRQVRVLGDCRFLLVNAVHGINRSLSSPTKQRAGRQVLVNQGSVNAITGRRESCSISFYRGCVGKSPGTLSQEIDTDPFSIIR